MFLLKASGLYCFDPDRMGEFFRYSNFVALHPDVAGMVLQGDTPTELL